jgi:hypothetical protein
MTLDQLLSEAETFITRYVRMGAEEALACALFVAYSHAVAAFKVAPYLNVTSPEPECGKTLLLEALSLLVREPWLALAPSEAVLFRYLDKRKPTLLLDETDGLFKGSGDRAEPIRCVLNSGYRRGVKVPRCQAKTFEPVEFEVFGAKCFSGIGDALPDTVVGLAGVAVQEGGSHPHQSARRVTLRTLAVANMHARARVCVRKGYACVPFPHTVCVAALATVVRT